MEKKKRIFLFHIVGKKRMKLFRHARNNESSSDQLEMLHHSVYETRDPSLTILQYITKFSEVLFKKEGIHFPSRKLES